MADALIALFAAFGDNDKFAQPPITVSYALWRAQEHIPRGVAPPGARRASRSSQAVVEHLELNSYEVRHDVGTVPHSGYGR
jgi:hypothetical protein